MSNEQNDEKAQDEQRAKLIPEGRYKGHAVATAYGLSKAGNETMAICFELSEDPYKGYHLYGSLSFSEAGEEISRKALLAMGFTGDGLALVQAKNECASTVLPKEVSLTVKHELYQGKWSAKVPWINALGGGLKPAEQPLDGAQKRGAAARLQALTGTKHPNPPKAGAKPAGKPGPVPSLDESDEVQGSGDDDIPY